MPKEIGTYPFINRFYGDYIVTGNKNPLTSCLENSTIRSEINSCLEILSPNPTLKRFIKKTKDDPSNFCDFLSELGVAAYLSNRVHRLEFQQSGKDGTPDLAIYIDEFVISFEVKRIRDKLADKPKGDVHIINDISTVMTAFKNSVDKGQYLPEKPHIIYFDCPSVSEGEYLDTFYPIAGPDTSITWEINHKLVHPSVVYNGYFQKKDYLMISGIACKFFTGQIIPKISEIVYFPNPNAMISIPEKIIGELGFVSKRPQPGLRSI